MKKNLYLVSLLTFGVFTLGLPGCKKETDPKPQTVEAYVRCTIDGQAFSLSGVNGVGVRSRNIGRTNNGFQKDTYWNTIDFNISYFGHPGEFFLIEIMDTTELREGYFDASDYPTFTGPNLKISYYLNQQWVNHLYTLQNDDAVVHITFLDERWIEGKFSGTFQNGVKVTDGEFKIFLGN